jgi:hypothetical protein
MQCRCIVSGESCRALEANNSPNVFPRFEILVALLYVVERVLLGDEVVDVEFALVVEA